MFSARSLATLYLLPLASLTIDIFATESVVEYTMSFMSFDTIFRPSPSSISLNYYGFYNSNYHNGRIQQR